MFAPNGEMIARIKSCAGSSCTNVAIGGANRDRLYITGVGDGHGAGGGHQWLMLNLRHGRSTGGVVPKTR